MGKELNIPAYVLAELKLYLENINAALAEATRNGDYDAYNQGRIIGSRYVLKQLGVEV